MGGVQHAHTTPADLVEQVRRLKGLSLHVEVVVRGAGDGDEPKAELVGEEVALAATVALDVRVETELLETTARTRQLLTAAHRAHGVLDSKRVY